MSHGISASRAKGLFVCALLAVATPIFAQQPKLFSCPTPAYEKALDARFNGASAGLNDVIILRILPAHRPESEIVLYQSGNSTAIIHLQLRDSVWARMSSFEKPPKDSECLPGIANTPMQGGTVPVPDKDADSLRHAFQQINLAGDHCIRNRSGKCGTIQDAGFYEVILQGGKERHRITDTAGTEFMSENTALLDWSRKVEAAVATAENPSSQK